MALENHIFLPSESCLALVILVEPIGPEDLAFGQTSQLRLEISLIDSIYT